MQKQLFRNNCNGYFGTTVLLNRSLFQIILYKDNIGFIQVRKNDYSNR